MTDAETSTELAVVGGGPGGYAAAIRAAQRGVDVTLVERDALGGVCLNAGCIPSKAMVTAADLVHRAGHADHMGIHADPSVDMAALAAWRDDVVEGMSDAVRKLCRANGVSLQSGTARFVDSDRLAVETAEGTHELGFERAIVATGSRAVEVPGVAFDDNRILAAERVLSLTTVPDRLVIVGAGYIGLELATAFAKLGSTVVVLEALDHILPGFGAELTRPVKARLDDLGVTVQLEHPVSTARATSNGVTVAAEANAEEMSVEGDVALVAVGREPLVDTVAPDAIGLEQHDSGALVTDRFGETSVESIYAVGDVSGEPMLAHAATRAGTAVAATIAGDEPEPVADAAIPAAAFTDPEVAAVGLTSDEATEAGLDPVTGTFPLRSSGRAITTDATAGFVRLVADSTGRVVGGQAVGIHASELIAEIGLAIEVEASLGTVADTVHAHPTLAEAVKEAAENATGEAIHTLNR